MKQKSFQHQTMLKIFKKTIPILFVFLYAFANADEPYWAKDSCLKYYHCNAIPGPFHRLPCGGSGRLYVSWFNDSWIILKNYKTGKSTTIDLSETNWITDEEYPSDFRKTSKNVRERIISDCEHKLNEFKVLYGC